CAADLTRHRSGTQSYEVTNQEEFKRSISLKSAGVGTVAGKIDYYLYLHLWPIIWDVYLYSEETVSLTYRKTWLWQQVRESIDYKLTVFKQPLAQLSFYEPMDEIVSVDESIYTPEVKDATKITISPRTTSLPDAYNSDQL